MDINSIIKPEHNHFEKYIFTGRVLPEYPGLDMPDPFLYRFEGYDGTVLYGSITMKNSLFQAIVRTDNTELGTVRNYVESQVRTLLDVFGFVNGFYFLANIQSAILPGDKQAVFDTSYLALQKRSPASQFMVPEMLAMSQDEPLRLALADIRSAMEHSVETGFFCYRAVETIMQSFKIGNDDDSKGWRKMHSALKTSKQFIEFNLKVHADVRRHGCISFIRGTERDACLVATAQIIDRYCQFLHNGKVELNETNFPVLKP